MVVLGCFGFVILGAETEKPFLFFLALGQHLCPEKFRAQMSQRSQRDFNSADSQRMKVQQEELEAGVECKCGVCVCVLILW